MPRSARDQFLIVAAKMAQNDLGREFIAALEPLAANATRELVFAPLEHLAYAQGVARQFTVLLDDIKTAPTKAQAIIAAEEKAAQQRTQT